MWGVILVVILSCVVVTAQGVYFKLKLKRERLMTRIICADIKIAAKHFIEDHSYPPIELDQQDQCVSTAKFVESLYGIDKERSKTLKKYL